MERRACWPPLVFDAHDRAFAFFKGACTRGIYDNMKTAVDTVFVGKDRAYNRRFLQMCGHYLVEPVACTPGAGPPRSADRGRFADGAGGPAGAGWEKGQVENQVGVARQRLFTPRLRFKSYDELPAGSRGPGCSTAASPGPRRSRTPRSASARSGRCSRPSGRA
jgi:hypothetical protein